MAANSFLSNQGTQSALLTDNTGGVGGTLIPVMKVSMDGQGTFTPGNIFQGTISQVNNIGTLPNVPGGSIAITSLPNISQGSINVTSGTVNTGTINSATISGGTINLATISGNLGTIGTIGLATISGNVGMSSGTLNVATISTLPNLPQGSINVTAGTISAGTLNTGTINTGTINLGTFVGKDANAAAQGGNPMGIGGTDSGGTIRTIKVDSGGLQRIGIDSGTISVLPNLPQGSINVTAGTMIMTTGTINSGTINTGTINLGTVVGKDANAVAQTGNPISIGGTDSGGTVRTVLVNSAGAMSVSGASSGTFNNISTGTMQTLGTVGTVQNILAGTISGLQNGTITTGTINTGTVNAGTINTGTVNVGTVYKGIAAGQAGSFTAAGTIVVSGSQSDLSYYDIGGTWVGTMFFEGQVGTSAWFAMPVVNSIGVAQGTTTTGNGDFMQSMAGLDGVRGRLTYSSGTLTYNQRSSNFFSPLHYVQTMADQINAAAIVNRGLVIAAYDGANGRFIASDSTGKLQVIQTAGTMGVGTITAGSIIVTAGTVSAGTVNTGTVNVGTINTGTINAGTINNGSIVVTAGTVSAGTINAGTFQQNPVPTIAQSTYGTHGTTGVSIFGTLAGGTGSGAGTELFITSLSLSIPSTGGSQDVSIGWGTNGGTFQAGTGLLVRGNFPPGGGIQKNFSPAVNSGTNAQLCLFQAGAGTVDVSVTYFTTPSTL